MSAPAIVLKFGSSVLARPEDLPRAVGEIRRWLRLRERVVAVVSAFAGTTEALLAQAGATAGQAAPEGLAAYLASGERQAAALLQVALEGAGISATLLDPLTVGLRASGDLLAGEPCALDRRALAAALARRPVAVLPGFFGFDPMGRLTLFGRGGSDWTALFVAWAMGAECRLLKGADGVYESDPALPGERERRYSRLSFADALALGAPVVQDRALRFAAAVGLPFTVAAVGSSAGTEVGPGGGR